MDAPLDLWRLLREAGVDAAAQLIPLAKALDDSPTVCYIVDKHFRFVHCNPAWDRFAAENGGRGLEREKMIGADLFASIPAPLVDAYKQAFESLDVTRPVWVKAYECSSPEVFRRFQMRIHLLDGRSSRFLVTNPLLVERPHERWSSASDTYVTRDFITMCSHCRCSRRKGTPEHWDFVPEYLRLTGADKLRVTHGLCPICLVYFYPDLAV